VERQDGSWRKHKNGWQKGINLGRDEQKQDSHARKLSMRRWSRAKMTSTHRKEAPSQGRAEANSSYPRLWRVIHPQEERMVNPNKKGNGFQSPATMVHCRKNRWQIARRGLAGKTGERTRETLTVFQGRTSTLLSGEDPPGIQPSSTRIPRIR